MNDQARELKLRDAVDSLLTAMLGSSKWKEDPSFTGTPERVARLYLEMLSPEANSWKTFKAESADLVLLRRHEVIALCPHHLLPVTIRCYVAYIPNKLTVGLSKLARAAEEHLTRPIMQEELAHKIIETLEEKLDPKGSAVILAGEHGCMKFRGVKSDGDIVTSVMKGVFFTNPAARMELMQLIGKP